MRYVPQLLTISFYAVALAAPSTSFRCSYSTFSQDDHNLSVFVDGYPASVGKDEAYVPITVAIALMRPGPNLSFTLESFTLVDSKGNEVRPAGLEELRKGYSRLDFDRTLVGRFPITVGMTIGSRPRIASNFYPPTSDVTRIASRGNFAWNYYPPTVGRGMKISRVELASYSWFEDVVYFPRPPAGLGGVLTLAVAVDGGDPIEVRFVVDPGELARL